MAFQALSGKLDFIAIHTRELPVPLLILLFKIEIN